MVILGKFIKIMLISFISNGFLHGNGLYCHDQIF